MIKASAESELDRKLLTLIPKKGEDLLVNHEIIEFSVKAKDLDIIIQRALADLTGSLHFGGFSGEELRNQMLFLTKKINPNQKFKSIEEFANKI